MEDADLLRQQIKTARIMLFIIAAGSLASALIFIPDPEWTQNPAGLWSTLLVAAAYFLLGLWAKKKPFTAIVVGLLLVLAIPLLLFAFGSPGYVHWPTRLLSLLLLGLGFADGRDAQNKMKGL